MKVPLIIRCLCLICCCPLTARNADDPVLIIGNDSVSAGEFLHFFRKNNPEIKTTSQASMEEYLERFINFKLKVHEARSLGYDTMPEFINELAGYRKQLARSYLTDTAVVNRLVKQAFERSRFDVGVSHILVRLAPDASPADTLAARERIMSARKRIIQGEDFGTVAKSVSEDPSVQMNGGDLGYITVFTTVYPFENAAYETPVGMVSLPVRSEYGYHILKVNDRRPARGQMRAAHIMIACPQGSSQERINEAQTRIHEIHERLIQGEDFGILAQQYSDDRATARRDGELEWFGVGRMVREFEDAAFALEKNGQISLPVKTSYGFHIIKRLDHRQPDSFTTVKDELLSRVQRDDRIRLGQESFVENLKKKYAFRESPGRLRDCYSMAGKAVSAGSWDPVLVPNPDSTLFSFAGRVFTLREFTAHLAAAYPGTETSNTWIDLAYKDFVTRSLLAYEEEHLDKKVPEFRYIMQEYHDGILLFNLSDKVVWSTALTDTVGLKKFFDENRHNYMWDTRVDATVYTCPTGINADRSLKEIKTAWKKQLQAETNMTDSIIIASGRFSRNDNEYVDAIRWKKGVYVLRGEGDCRIVQIKAIIPPVPRELYEVRGQVTADYQSYLEKQWIDALRRKYPVRVDRDLLKTIVK